MQAAEISETQITSHIISSNKAVISESKSQLSITDEASVPESASGDTIESGQTEGARSLVETGVTLEIFHLFPTLPPELKLKIWHMALLELGPRLIEILWSARRGLCTDCSIPAYLHVNVESRVEASNIYKQFRTTCGPITSETGEVQEPYIYINYDKDMLFLSLRNAADRKRLEHFDDQISEELVGPSILPGVMIESYIIQVLVRNGAEHVQHIAVSTYLTQQMRRAILENAIHQFRKLKTCSTAVDDHDCDYPVVGYTIWSPTLLPQPAWLSKVNFGSRINALPGSLESKLEMVNNSNKKYLKNMMKKGGREDTLVDSVDFSMMDINRHD